MSVEVSTALPAVTLDEAKLHLRVESTADDDLISALILACTQMAEHELQRGLVTREGTEGYGDSPEAVPGGYPAVDSRACRLLLRAPHFGDGGGFVAASFCERAA